jgi:PKD repeat protein
MPDDFSYAWDFDNDGTYDSTIQNPTHTFTSAGTKTVVLKVTDGQGGVGFASATVEVGKLPATVELSDLSHTYDGSQKSAAVTTDPEGLPVSITYEGLPGAPIDAGNYDVVATVVDDVYQGSDSAELVISPAVAGITLDNLDQEYDGTSKSVSVITDPTGLDYSLTYSGEPDPPTATDVYAVEVIITDTNYTGTETGSLLIRKTQEITLVPGWNLVSFNLQPYPSKAPSDVLAAINGSFDQVYAWDASGGHVSSGHWMSYDNVELTTDTLTELDETLGFWINITAGEDQTLSLKGFMPDQTSIDLISAADGWNLVGFPSALTSAPADSFSGVSQLSRVLAYEATDGSSSWKLYEPGTPDYLNDLTTMETGYGYWVLVTGDDSWDVNY